MEGHGWPEGHLGKCVGVWERPDLLVWMDFGVFLGLGRWVLLGGGRGQAVRGACLCLPWLPGVCQALLGPACGGALRPGLSTGTTPAAPSAVGTWGAACSSCRGTASPPATGSPALLSPLMRAASSLPATQHSLSHRRFLWKNLGELGCQVFTSRCMCRIAGVLPTIHLACGHRALSAARVPTGPRLCVTLPPDLHAVSHVSHVGCASQQC